MNSAKASPESKLVCAGVGNSSIQFARFPMNRTTGTKCLPKPLGTASVTIVDSFTPPPLDDNYRDADWVVASVNRPATKKLREWAEQRLKAKSFRILENDQFPLRHRVKVLAHVGSDRLAAAVAANCLRADDRSAIFIDAGTALTVNVLAADGAFLGGAILPGLGSSLRALAKHTDQLPLVDLNLTSADQAPLPVGDDTEAAIRSGVYWGLVGTARELIRRMSHQVQADPQILVTGGFGIWLSRELGGAARTNHTWC